MSLIIDREQHGGTQKVYRFANGYGASIISAANIPGFGTSYGYEEGLLELAVLEFPYEDDRYHLTYETEITNDVLGSLTEEDVAELLTKIEQLESK
jgi:hypothetical protein